MFLDRRTEFSNFDRSDLGCPNAEFSIGSVIDSMFHRPERGRSAREGRVGGVPAQVEVLGCLCLGPGAFSSRRSFAEISLADMRATIWEERPRAAERLALEHRGREFHLRPADAPSLLVK